MQLDENSSLIGEGRGALDLWEFGVGVNGSGDGSVELGSAFAIEPSANSNSHRDSDRASGPDSNNPYGKGLIYLDAKGIL
jgi:hypothetical protein